MNEQSKNRALLTIGIPTFNRAYYLNRCLENVYSQIGNDPRFEVLVCDNASTDETEVIVNLYKKRFPNLVYVKNETNIGATMNFQKVLDLATGEYVNLHGDDDYFKEGVYHQIVNMIANNKDCEVMALPWGYRNFNVKRGVGISNYIIDARNPTGISWIILGVDAYRKIEDKEKFLYSLLNHMYIQLEILSKNPNYCVLQGPIARLDSAGAQFSGYNAMEVIMKNYLDIIYSYEGNGLTPQEVKIQKEFLLILLFSFIEWIIRDNMSIDLKGSVELFTDYYKDEVYFEARVAQLKSILARRP